MQNQGSYLILVRAQTRSAQSVPSVRPRILEVHFIARRKRESELAAAAFASSVVDVFRSRINPLCAAAATTTIALVCEILLLERSGFRISLIA